MIGVGIRAGVGEVNMEGLAAGEGVNYKRTYDIRRRDGVNNKGSCS